jgi:hypothetical protein
LSRLGNFWEDVGPCTESTRELENQACKPANMKSWEMCQQVPGRTTMGPTRCVTTISGHCSWTTLVTCCLCVPTAVSTLHCLVCHTLSVDASGTTDIFFYSSGGQSPQHHALWSAKEETAVCLSPVWKHLGCESSLHPEYPCCICYLPDSYLVAMSLTRSIVAMLVF